MAHLKWRMGIRPTPLLDGRAVKVSKAVKVRKSQHTFWWLIWHITYCDTRDERMYMQDILQWYTTEHALIWSYTGLTNFCPRDKWSSFFFSSIICTVSEMRKFLGTLQSIPEMNMKFSPSVNCLIRSEHKKWYRRHGKERKCRDQYIVTTGLSKKHHYDKGGLL